MPLRIFQPDQRARLKPCLRCGYSLRHNIDARNCPECGLAVRVSFHDGDALDWSNPAWVRRHSAAALVLALGHAGLLAGMAGLLVARQTGISPVALFVRARQGVGILTAVSVILLCVGAMMLAAPEGRHPDRTRGRRRVLWVLAPLAVVLINLDLLPPQVRGELIPLLRVSAWVGPAASIAVTSIAWWALHDAVRRIPARRCAKLTAVLGATVGIGGPVLLVAMRPRIFFVLLVAPWDPRFAPLTITCLLYLPIAVAVLIYCSVQFRSAAREADRNWVTDP